MSFYPDNFTSLHPESPEYRERKLDADEAWDKQRAARNECDYLSDELAVRSLITGAMEQTDLLAVARGTLAAIMAVEGVENTAKLAGDDLRRALAFVMAETGMPGIRTDFHTASCRDAAQSVVITDASLIPEDLMTRPAPSPDKKAIAKRLRDGLPVPGAALSNGGAPILTIRAREEATA